jgi:DNA-binding PadR family transcriptional regulator
MASPTECTRLELDILSVLLDAVRSGADVHREVCEQFETGPARTTVYRALKGLDSRGLVQSESTSMGRSNTHRITPEGAKTVRRYAAVLTVRVQAAEYASAPYRR